MIGKTISHYKIIEKLGEGGMGVVYKAQDTKLDRLVALKFLPPHLTSEPVEKERFIHEAKAASALSHTNITTIHEIDEFEGHMFIVMEYCEGRTLKQVIEKETLSIKKVLDIGIQVCEGLAMAHEKGIVHRDIKSDNIMLTPRGQVKIMDFGLAKLKGATKLTKTRSTLGTLAYMSPEQTQGEEVDYRSDIFSFGVVLYELLTGKLPFGGEHQAAVIYSIINEEPQPIARFNNQVSAKLEDMVYKALAKEKDERYQHIDDLLADLRRERKSFDYVKTGQISKEAIAPKPKKKVLPIVIPASIVFILVLLFLILKPFKFEIGPEKGAVAKENSLAIMYFENLVDTEDKQKLGEIVTNLLITGLSESQYLKVVSSQRLYDILKLLGKEGQKRIDKNIATQVATKAGAKWMLLGSILQVKPRIEITTQLVDVGTGEIKTSQRITGEKEQDVFSLVDKLTVALKKDLSLPAAAQQEKEPSVAKVTTHSQEAYRYYLEGMDYSNKYYWTEAEKSLKKALEFDSTFAMAYYWLAVINQSGDDRAAREFIAKAAKYTDKITQKEKLYIKGFEAYITGDYSQAINGLKKIVESYPDEKDAFYVLGQIYYRNLHEFEEAVHYLSKAIQIDPLYKLAYNFLAYTYNEMGDFEKSIWAINKYIELAPDEPNPYDSRAELYAWNGKLDQAIESYKKALEIKPDFYSSQYMLGDMYVFKKDYVKAENCFQALSSSSEKRLRSMGRLYLERIPFYQGKFEDALKVLDDGIAGDRMEQFEGDMNAYKHFDKAFLLYERQKKMGLALKEVEMGMEIYKKAKPNDPIYGRDGYAFLLTKSGKIAEAEELAKALKKDIEEKNPKLMFSYWWTLGDIELIKRDTNMALSYLERAYKDSPTPSFDLRSHLAEIYLKTGRLDEAVSELERALSRYDDDRVWSSRAVKAYYLLGLAYEKSGWNKKAIEKYEEFLDIWKNADPGIKEVEDAKERLKRLKK
ncbi:MAG: protein kinase [candidate division Zixibacteria bacterium]|nr:protein kinase [candidate division Zixibacteria bacterium]